MVRGHPDYGQSKQTKIVHSVLDLGELAARLGSPDVFQRSGEVIFIDSFENGISAYFTNLMGTGAAVDLMGDRSYHGGLAVRLTGGSDGGRRAQLLKRFHVVELNQMGIETTFSLDADTEFVCLSLVHRTGTNEYTYSIYANMAEGKFQYYDEDMVKQDLDSFNWGVDDLDHWHTMKMIVDLENNKYVRTFYNEKGFSLVNIEPKMTESTEASRVDLFLWNYSDDGLNGIAYIDSFILTINEP